MKRLAVLAVMIASGPVWAEDWVEEADCPLKFGVQPEGAFVILDGKVIGKAPVGEFQCPEGGVHTVVVQKDGYYGATRTFSFQGGWVQRIEVKLVEVEGHGRIVVSAETDVTVVVDGRNEGLAPWEGGVEVGDHEVKFMREGEVIKKETVTVGEGQTAQVSGVVVKEKKEKKKLHWGYLAGSGGLAVGGGVVMVALAVVGKKHHDEYMDFREEAKAGTFVGDPVQENEEYKDKGQAINAGLVAGMVALGVGIAAAAALIPFTDFEKVEVQTTGTSVTVRF